MTDKTAKPGELLSRFPEINFNNYGQQEVEALQAWALEAFDALSATLSPAHIEDGEEVEVVGYQSSSSGLHPMETVVYPELYAPLMTVAQHQRIVAARASKAVPRVEDERKAFEAWMHTFDMPPQLEGEVFLDEQFIDADCYGQFVYEDHSTQRCWAAWQARAALSAPPAAQDYFPRDLLVSSVMNADEVDPTKVAALSTPPAAGTTSDQYRAELYDEVWQKARDLGYGNVTDALVELERIKAAPPAAGVPDVGALIKRLQGCEPHLTDKVHYCSDDADDYRTYKLDLYIPTPARDPEPFEVAAARWLGAAPTPPASEQQRAVVMPERKAYPDPEGCSSNPEWWARQHEEAKSWNDCLDDFLRLNPHLAKGEGV